MDGVREWIDCRVDKAVLGRESRKVEEGEEEGGREVEGRES